MDAASEFYKENNHQYSISALLWIGLFVKQPVGFLSKSILFKNISLDTYSWFSSVAQACLTVCDPTNRSTPGLPVHHQLPESTQTHVHCVNDAIQPSHLLSSPFPPALNPSQHQGLFHGPGLLFSHCYC